MSDEERPTGVEQYERSKKKRRTIRSSTTRLLNQIDVELLKEDKDIDRVRDMLAVLSAKEDSLRELDSIVEKHTSLEDVEAEIELAEEYRDRVIEMKARAHRVIRENETVSNPRPAQSSDGNVSENKPTVRLPKLQIERFSGDVSVWQEFWSQYETAIHSNSALCKKEKFTYLKTYLTGTAARAVAGLTLTDSNYDAAVDILRSRFGRKDLIVNAHMSKLLNLTPVKKSSDVSALRQLYDDCEIQIRSLESLGVVSDTYGSMLCPILLQMMPDDMALEYSRHRGDDDEWNVPNVLKFLQKEVQSRERTLQMMKSYNQRENQSANKTCSKSYSANDVKSKKPSMPSAAALHIADQKTQNCLFCDSTEHKSEKCPDHPVSARKEKLKKLGRCFVCLGTKHIARFCRSKCRSCATCGGRHHAAICEKIETSPPAAAANIDTVISSVIPQAEKCKPDIENTVLLQTAKAWVVGPTSRKMVRCLLDGGSQGSFVHENVVKALQLPVTRQGTLTLHTFGSSAPTTVSRNIVKLSLENVWDNRQGIEIEAVVTPKVCTALMKVPGEHIQMEMKTRGLQLADCAGDDKPELAVLIGSDYYWQIVSGRVERLTKSLVALESIFGWAVQGPVAVSSMTETSCMHIQLSEDAQIDNQLHAFWELESLGIINEKSESPEDVEALQRFEETSIFKDGRYQVELPWRQHHPPLQDNYRIAKKRLESLKRKLSKDVTLYSRYNEVVEDYLNQGMAEDVPREHASPPGSQIYYLPHHAVLREDKATTKLRVVFDASSHEDRSPSLNDCLLTGPNLNPDLMSILIKFRLHEIAYMADIKKAFLQISLSERDRDAVRFLWFTGPPTEEKDVTLRLLRMTRVVFGASSSPFLLAATIRKHLRQYELEHPQVVEALSSSLYVDDFISSASGVTEAHTVTTTARNIMSAAGMELCKWMTNSPELKEKWQQGLMDCAVHPESHVSVLKVLGMVWRPATDDFVFDLRGLLDILKERENTKRSVLQSSARIFDPLGFLTPFTIRIKCLFQEMWERGIKWDEKLPLDLTKKWQQWCSELPQLHQLSIPRWYQTHIPRQDGQVLRLHVFCDSSERAYSAVAYLQGETKEGEVTASLVASKSRVAPLKRMTLPRLELMGAVIAARLGNTLMKALQLDKTQLRLWTDSMIVLHWICGSAHKWKQFVANRVTEIQSLTDPQSWSHCKGKINPADLPTRGLTVQDLKQSTLWWNGPCVPMSTDQLESTQEDVQEDEVKSELRSKYQIAVQLVKQDQDFLSPVLCLEKYSKLKTVLRVTAWIKRFITNTRSSINISGELTAEELNEANKNWIKVIQNQSFSSEIDLLKAGKCPNTDSRIRELKPFLDEDELLSVGGRLQHSDLSYREKHPWILPNNHRYTEMLVQYEHEKIMHAGVRDTLVQTREKYWILRARQVVKKVVSRCVICKKFKAKAGQQTTAPLPRDRITESPPFEITGVDFAGPLYVKTQNVMTKAYIALFTCAVTRAVHLELVSDMSTENFLLALKRFISRRGLCKVMYSDNAKTFKRADQDLKELWKGIKDPRLQEFFSEKGITWRFIAERAAWWGGFWERLVRSVKVILRKVLGRAKLNFEEMCTILTEAEAIINSRPLTYVHNEVDEPEPLTPAHFLVGQRLTCLPPKPCAVETNHPTANKEEMNRRWRYRQRLMNNIWNRWRREYLLNLKSAHRCDTPQSSLLKVGDVALIGEDNTPRQSWRLGRIEELFPGRDGLVRSCAVRTSSGTVLRRPIQLLYPLEII